MYDDTFTVFLQGLSDNQISALTESQAGQITTDQYNAFPDDKKAKVKARRVPTGVTDGSGGGGGASGKHKMKYSGGSRIRRQNSSKKIWF